jgi:hypothetical protein
VQKLQCTSLLQDVYLVVKTDKPISFIPTQLDHFDEKIKLIAPFEELKQSAENISDQLISSKTLDRYNKYHCNCLTSLGSICQVERMKSLSDAMFCTFTCDGTLTAGKELEVMLVRGELEEGLRHKLMFIKSAYVENLTAEGEELYSLGIP